MYARVARFDGVDPSGIDFRVEEIKRSMEAASAGELPENAPAELGTLLGAVTRYMQLVDRETGTMLGIAFCETAEDARRAHEALDAMSPGDDEGKRTSAGIFEVAIDQNL
jgi:hypothetical protein